MTHKTIPPINPPTVSATYLFVLLSMIVPSLSWAQNDNAASAPQAAAARAIVVGRVANQATGAYLEGAEITVTGTDIVVTTDRDGSYTVRVPEGKVLLTASYTGLESETVELDAQGSTTVHNFGLTSAAYQLEPVVVPGFREGDAFAATRQRLAETTRNVVASDSFGNTASGNVGEILQQLPGVAAIWSGADIQTVQIRGIDPSLSTVTVNGDQMAQSQSAGLGRQFEFDTTSVGGFEMLEVMKVPTPDMPADSIGGRINLVSKSAFDRADGRMFTYSIGGVYRLKFRAPTSNRFRQPISGVGPALNFSYSDVFGKKRNLGIILTASVYGQPGGDTATFIDREWVLKDPQYIWRMRTPRPSVSDILRTSYSAKVDYKLSPHTTLSLNGSYTWFYNFLDIRTHDLNPARTIATLDANGNRVGAGVIDPRYTQTFTRIYQSKSNRSTLTASASDRTAISYQIQPLVTHKFDDLLIEYGGSYSSSVTYYDQAPDNRHYNSRPKGSVNTTMNDIGWDVDASQSAGWPSFTQTAGPDIYNLNNYGKLTLNQPNRGGVNHLTTARLNVRKRFDTRFPTTLKVGLNYKENYRRIWNHSRSYTFLGNDGVAGNAEDNIAQFLDTSGVVTSDYYMGYRPAPYPSPYAAARDQMEHPERWSLNTVAAESAILNNRRKLSETVKAAYVMGTVRFKDLLVLGGLRAERTEVEGFGPLRQTGQPIRFITAKGTYDNVFPGLHVKYSPGRNWVARASYSTSIGRPPVTNIIPTETVNDNSMTVSGSNPDLKPQMSTNYDVGLEYYFEPAGVLSASVFRKDLEDFIYSDSSQVIGSGPDNGYDGLYEGYRLVTPNNGGKGRYRGIELAYQQQFRFLPGFWSGFGLNLSYTHIDTKGDYGKGIPTDKLAGFVPEYVSSSISYNRDRWSIRLNGVWRSTYFANVNANPALMQFQREKLTMSLKLLYKWRPWMSFFCDIDNLNASPVADYYYGRPEDDNYIRPGTQKIVTGIQGRF